MQPFGLAPPYVLLSSYDNDFNEMYTISHSPFADGRDGQRTPPAALTDFPGSPFDPLDDVPIRPRPPSPPSGNPPPPPPPPRYLILPRVREEDPVEVGLLKAAAAAGCLQDVHQILSQYIMSVTPDTRTGKLFLNLFAQSITEAIRNQHSIVLSYLFFMRVGDPSLHIHTALRTRSAAIFQAFLDDGWNINEPIERAMSPALGYISDDRELTEWFLDHHADPNARCAWDYTPMSEAMRRASMDTIKLLFERGGDIERGQLLHNAVLRDTSDNVELVGLLLDMGAHINEIQYKNHPQSYWERYPFALGTPLHYAAEEGKCQLVSYLINRGADPSIQNTRGRTVIETAEHVKQSEVVQLLRVLAST